MSNGYQAVHGFNKTSEPRFVVIPRQTDVVGMHHNGAAPQHIGPVPLLDLHLLIMALGYDNCCKCSADSCLRAGLHKCASEPTETTVEPLFHETSSLNILLNDYSTAPSTARAENLEKNLADGLLVQGLGVLGGGGGGAPLFRVVVTALS